MDLSKLSPETVAVLVGTIWLVREVLGFAAKFQKSLQPAPVNTQGAADCATAVKAMEKVAGHIEANTALIREFIFEIKGLQRSVDDLDERFTELSREFRRKPQTVHE